MTAAKAKAGAKRAAGRAEEIAADVASDLEGRLRDITGVAGKSFEEAVDLGEDAVAAVVDFVEREPWKAVAIAGAVGLLVGLAARR